MEKEEAHNEMYENKGEETKGPEGEDKGRSAKEKGKVRKKM
jgi:hypothetical protein